MPRGKPQQMSEYQTYVKENYGRVRSENVGVEQAGVMRLLGKGYKDMKAAAGVGAAKEMGRGEGGDAGETVDISDDEAGGLGSVARKLDFLSLRA